MSSDTETFRKNLLSLLTEEMRSSFLDSNKQYKSSLDSFLSGNDEISLSLSLKLSAFMGISLERLSQSDLTKKRADLKLLVLDVDGVLTEGGMFYTQSGDEFKRFHTRDGMAIRRLTKTGFRVAFLSSGINDKLINARAELLGVQLVYVGLEPKLHILERWKTELKLDWSQIAYVGDDVNDVEVMKLCGFTACPADAVVKVKNLSDIILHKNGGDGCIREFIEDYFIEI